MNPRNRRPLSPPPRHPRLQIIPVHPGDEVDRDLLRAHRLALLVVGARAEGFLLHLGDHLDHPVVALGQALRHQGLVRDLGRGTASGHQELLDALGKAAYPLPMTSTVSSKGQITVPVKVREQLGLAPGTRVVFELREDGVFLRKGFVGVHPVDRVFGVLRLEGSVDEAMDEMRGPRPSPK